MIFEGSEKKAEIVVDATYINLLQMFEQSFWSQLVKQCNAEILSKLETNDCTSYILSESSLFIWKDRFIIITCGLTTLVNAIEYFIQNINKEHVNQVTYQRKNEYFSHAQSSSFEDDVAILSQYFRGNAFRFGNMHSHHSYIFQYSEVASTRYKTNEILIYQISEDASYLLTRPNLEKSKIREYLQLETLLPGWTINDHVFSPFGYSLNGLSGKNYITIHVTPQKNHSYVSIEANMDLSNIAKKLLDVLSPASFDVLTFNEDNVDMLLNSVCPAHFIQQSFVTHKLPSNDDISFAAYVKPVTKKDKAVLLPESSN